MSDRPVRTWVEISRGALRRNWAYVRARVPAATELCAVVKADAYGHGAVACAREFCAAGAGWLAVTSVEEGAILRRAADAVGRPRILVLGGFARAEAADLVRLNLTPVVWDAEQIRWLGDAGRERILVHLELETGLGRLGLTAEQEGAFAEALAASPQVEIEAVLSHLAASEAADPSLAIEQHRRLARLANNHRWHLYNSEGAMRFSNLEIPDATAPGMLARVGLALYGYSAQPEHAAHLEPALRWLARVVSVKDLPAGHGVGYGHRFRTAGPSRVAVVSAGYADGYRRDFGPSAELLIHGRRAPVIGAVSMDLIAVDATAIGPLALGDEVTLLGPGLGADRIAANADTIAYEVLCGISSRVERRYTD